VVFSDEKFFSESSRLIISPKNRDLRVQTTPVTGCMSMSKVSRNFDVMM
jgi:hypothetical protein